MTDRTWPENVMPTATQWLDWLLTLDRAEQLDQAEMVMANVDAAHTCFIANHAGLAEELRASRDYVARAYQEGVNDAAQAIRDGLAAEAS